MACICRSHGQHLFNGQGVSGSSMQCVKLMMQLYGPGFLRGRAGQRHFLRQEVSCHFTRDNLWSHEQSLILSLPQDYPGKACIWSHSAQDLHQARCSNVTEGDSTEAEGRVSAIVLLCRADQFS